jgi:GNAT superfamily N-acetyltransferase
MHVTEIDPHDDAQLREWWEVSKAVEEYGREGLATHWSLRAATVAMRATTGPFGQVPLAVYVDGKIAGIHQFRYPKLDNTHMVWVEPKVLPEYRRRGIGAALMEDAERRTRELGRTTMAAEINLPDDEAEESGDLTFARKHGFEIGILDVHRMLELPVDPELLDRLEADSTPHHADYRLVTWQGRVPDEHMEGYCALQAAFNSEAPSGDMDVEDEVWDEARVREVEERTAKQGRLETVTVAVDANGRMAGLTEMMSTEETTEFAWQGGTLVLKSDRGHRLGMAMKVANLRAFTATLPECRAVHSWNAEENGPMIAINDRLGFRAVERAAELQRKLAP